MPGGRIKPVERASRVRVPRGVSRLRTVALSASSQLYVYWTGAATFAASIVKRMFASPAVSGSGELVVSITKKVFAGTVSFAGSAALAVTATLQSSGVVWNGAGTLAVSIIKRVFASPALDGAGSLSVTATLRKFASPEFTGSGSLTATASGGGSSVTDEAFGWNCAFGDQF